VKAEQTARLSALFDAHEQRLYCLGRRLAPSIDDALDLVQDTFLKAARAPESVPHGLQNEEAWLVRVLVNIRRDQWRREKVRKRHDHALKNPTIQDDDPERSFVIRTLVWSALDHLPPRRRAVIVLHEIDGLETASIASLLGITAITVRWHLVQGRRELARRLKIQLGDFDETQHALTGGRPRASRPTAR
jgi:RNA polymerase sigma-70 factor, ECF subfamily